MRRSNRLTDRHIETKKRERGRERECAIERKISSLFRVFAETRRGAVDDEYRYEQRVSRTCRARLHDTDLARRMRLHVWGVSQFMLTIYSSWNIESKNPESFLPIILDKITTIKFSLVREWAATVTFCCLGGSRTYTRRRAAHECASV